jgi:hypothetical protein
MIRVFFSILLVGLLSSCTVYTEKRSESLSQAVFATADSISGARFDLSYKYAEQAKRLAYPPKKPIEITRVFTKEVVTPNEKKTLIPPSFVTATLDNKEQRPVLRLVVPEFLKHTKLLIENSEEWNEMVKAKEFAKQLEADKQTLQKLTSDIDAELQRQYQMNSKMVEDLNKLQKQVLAKDLLILKLYIVIVGLILMLGGGVYLRMKGIL